MCAMTCATLRSSSTTRMRASGWPAAAFAGSGGMESFALTGSHDARGPPAAQTAGPGGRLAAAARRVLGSPGDGFRRARPQPHPPRGRDGGAALRGGRGPCRPRTWRCRARCGGPSRGPRTGRPRGAQPLPLRAAPGRARDGSGRARRVPAGPAPGPRAVGIELRVSEVAARLGESQRSLEYAGRVLEHDPGNARPSGSRAARCSAWAGRGSPWRRSGRPWPPIRSRRTTGGRWPAWPSRSIRSS